MENGYYITSKRSGMELGVDEKIATHIRMFSKYFNMRRIEIPENCFVRKYISKFPFGISGRDYHTVAEQIDNASFIYIRKVPFDRNFIVFLKTIRKKSPGCKVLIELPTYPYDKDEYDKWFNYFVLRRDIKYRLCLKDLIDVIVTYSNDDNIFGCQTLKVSNGIDCDSVEPISDYDIDFQNIRLIAVARLRKHHGYERLINGLADYYKLKPKRAISFTIIGDGPELASYKKLVREKQLNSYVKFVGPVASQKLIHYYNKSDVAISSLGFYKIGINFSSNLKNRDYMSRGLPIVCCCGDSAFYNNSHVHIVRNDESNVSIDEIIQFVDETYRVGKECIVKEIRNIAIQNVDICATYRDVINYIL